MPPRKQSGFTLVLTLIVLAAITILVLGLFANVTSESSTAVNYDNAFRAQAAVHSGLSRVKSLLQRGTWNDDYLVLEHLQNPPPTTSATPTNEEWRQRKPVLTLARAYITGDTHTTGYTAQWNYTPLTSGVTAPATTSGTPTLPATALVPAMDLQTQAPNQVAIGLPKRMPWQPAQDSYWEVIYEERDTDHNPRTPSVKVPVSRYCFQVEDLQGLLSLDHAGNPGDAVEVVTGMLSRPHEREQFSVYSDPTSQTLKDRPRYWYAGLAPGLRTPDDDPRTNDRCWVISQAALYSLIDPTATDDASTVDNQIMAARHTVRTDSPTQVTSLLLSPDSWKPILMKEDISNPWPNWLQRTPITLQEDGTSRPNDEEAGRLPESPARRLEENTITGLRPYYEYPLIPAEPSVFARPREPKMNLNRVLTQVEQGTLSRENAVALIAGHIKKHLPEFETRAGGLPLGNGPSGHNAYLLNLAASIIDYADTDCLPTIDPNTADPNIDLGVYRGCDSYPLVNEQYLVNKWEGTVQGGTRWVVRFSITFFYELWNMTNRSITGTFQAEYSNKAILKAGVATPADLSRSFDKLAYGSPQPIAENGIYWMQLYEGSAAGPNLASTTITLLPNQYKVVGTQTLTFEIDGGSNTFQPVGPIPELSDDLNSHYRLRFKPLQEVQTPPLFGKPPLISAPMDQRPWVVMDRSRSRMDRKGRSFSTSSTANSGTMAGSSCNINNGGVLGNFVNNIGDPRCVFHQSNNLYQAAVAYLGGASPGGRNFRPSIANTKFYKEVFPSKWPNRGHDSLPYGNLPSSDSITPFMVAPVWPSSEQAAALLMQQAPQRISNAGRYFSVTELGNIYDPIFWDPNGNANNPEDSTNDQGWSFFWDIGSSAQSSPHLSGGNTLRIGRPEHSRFRSLLVRGSATNRRMAASTLLDLFHCGIPLVGNLESVGSGAANLRDITGPLTEVCAQVNLNTASKDTLRSLFTGLLKTDPALTPTSIQLASYDELANAIIKARPYISPAQLPERVAKTSTQPSQDRQPILGNTSFYSDWNANSRWSDTAAEELFARLYNSSTVRSRHFRVFVTGQAVQPVRSNPGQLEVTSTRSRVFHVFVNPLRDATTGLINQQRVEVIYEQDL